MTIGTFCLVLHSHLPWVAHHGAWPVGEEWLHQAWARAYGPVSRVLMGLADDGITHALTLGITPILAAQLDDPYCLAQHDIWLADWQLRAIGRAASGNDVQRASGHYEYALAQSAREHFDAHWSRGGAPLIRRLVESAVIEVIGGPATHPFQPLLDDRIIHAQLATGLHDATWRFGGAPTGIWAPECGYRPGLEAIYAAHGVETFLVDGPTLGAVGASTARAWQVGDTVVVGRDLDVTYRVWSPRKGYPGGRWYQDFHTFDHDWGLKPARVTSTRTAPQDKSPYDPDAARAAVQRDAQDFVGYVVARMTDLAETTSDPIVVAAYDTELFGHWWHEGPHFLDLVLRMLPEAGVRLATLGQLRERAHDVIDIPAGSWGSGKDWRVWDGAQVGDLVALHADLQREFLAHVDALPPSASRLAYLDDALQHLFLALSSDWAFMVTKDSAAQYARARAYEHGDRMRAILHDRTPDPSDRPFGHLDARALIAGRP